MKAQITIMALLLLAAPASFGKKNAVAYEEPHYAMGVAQVNAGTGHGTGYTVNGGVIKGRKSLEVGVIYSEKESRIAGGDFKYRVFLGNLYRIENDNKIYSPYLQYNLMYQKSTSTANSVVELGGENYEIQDEPGTVATMGHFLAFGNKIKVFEHAFVDSSIGLGIYQGSMDQVNGPDTWGVHNGNSGMTFSFKVGFGYRFN